MLNGEDHVERCWSSRWVVHHSYGTGSSLVLPRK